MAQQSQQSQSNNGNRAGKTIKQCICGATVFYGPMTLVEIIDDKVIEREKIFTCVHCAKDQRIDQMYDRVVPVPVA